MKDEILKLQQQINDLKEQHSLVKAKELFMDKKREMDYNLMKHFSEQLIETFPEGCSFIFEGTDSYFAHQSEVDEEDRDHRMIELQISMPSHIIRFSYEKCNKQIHGSGDYQLRTAYQDNLNTIVFSPIHYQSKDVERVISIMEWLLDQADNIEQYNTLLDDLEKIQADIRNLTEDYEEFNKPSELPEVFYPEHQEIIEELGTAGGTIKFNPVNGVQLYEEFKESDDEDE